jgi:hypothetical protein
MCQTFSPLSPLLKLTVAAFSALWEGPIDDVPALNAENALLQTHVTGTARLGSW